MRASHLRLGLRLARRELRRRPWRTALVLLMVLVPSAAMTLVLVSIRTNDWDAVDRHRAEYGRADASAYPDGEGTSSAADRDALLAAFPTGTRMSVRRSVGDRVRTADRRTYLAVYDTRLDDPMNDGRFGPVRGRLPRTGDEVVVTTELAERLGVDVGDRFRLDRLARTVEVVGTVIPNSADSAAYVGAPLPTSEQYGVESVFDLPDNVAVEQVIESTSVPGWQVTSLHFDGGDGGSNVFWVYLGGGVGLIVLGTIITAAFAVGARRQLRSIGLLSASGAAPTTVKWFLVAQGALAGAIGSIVGTGLAVLAVQFVPHTYVEDVAGRPIAGPVVRVADLLPIVAIGVVVAAAACWIPARSAAKVPTLQALAGRRPLPKVPNRLPVLGATGIAAGCALLAMAVAGSRRRGTSGASSLWAVVAIAGGLAVVMGAISIAPWVVAQLEWLGRGLRPGGRMASRSLARNRVRSSAVIGAICAVAIVVVAGSTLYVSSRDPGASDGPYLHSDQVLLESSRPDSGESVAAPAPAVLRRIRRDVPGVVVIPLRTPKLPAPTVAGTPRHGAEATLLPDPGPAWDGSLGVVVASDAMVDHFEVPEDLRAALDRGEVVAITKVPGGVTRVAIHRPRGFSSSGSDDGAELPFGGSFESPRASEGTNHLLVGPAGLARAGLESEASPTTLLVLPEDAIREGRAKLELLNDDLNWEIEETGGEHGLVQLYIPSEPPPFTEAQIKSLLFAFAALLVLAVVAVGLALASQDEVEERQILDAVGAPPRLVRRATASKAGLLVLVAGALAVPAGLLPAITILAATDSESRGGDWRFRVDVPSLLLVLVVVPLLAGGATWVGGRIRTWVRPDRPDVFAFGD